MMYEVWNPDDGEIRDILADEETEAVEELRRRDDDDWEAPDSYPVAVRAKGESEWRYYDAMREYWPSFSASALSDRPEGFELPEDEP